ncbi:hypothetical protein FS837_000521, partial [Tulasnella sp. UAMH 9824]
PSIQPISNTNEISAPQNQSSTPVAGESWKGTIPHYYYEYDLSALHKRQRRKLKKA